MLEIPFRAAITGCVLSLLLAACRPVAASELEPLARVTVEQARAAVVAELRLRGMAENELPRIEDVELGLAVPARTGSSLRVSSVCWDAEAQRARFRLECRAAGACLPFLVYVRSASHAQAASCQAVPERHSRAQVSAPAVRAGQTATAVMLASGIRMTAAVTCLDRGARGEIVRVRGGEGRIFRARVAGPALVEAVIE